MPPTARKPSPWRARPSGTAAKIFNENHCAPALLWDPEAMEFTNAPEANQYLRRDYRDGWTLTSEV